MSDLFIKIFNLSVTAGWLTLAVLICRPLMKKAPKWINCLLWGIVGLRLIFPFKLESIFSLIPSAEPIPQNIMMSPTPEINSGIGAVNSVINPIISTNLTPGIGASVNPMQLVVAVASVVWVIGIALMLGYEIVSYISLRFKVRASVREEKNVYSCDEVDSPFILGVIRPRIYLPSGMRGEALEHVLAHERAHLRRGDHFWKPVGFALLAFYWFNPLLWVAYALLCRDIESACDEKVIKTMDTEAKKSYSEALLACSLHRKRIMACPLAFGEVGVKQRIKSVLNYKKPAFWVIIVALVATLVVSICFLTNPRGKVKEMLKSGSEWDCMGDPCISFIVDDYGMKGAVIYDSKIYSIVVYRQDVGFNTRIEIYNSRDYDGDVSEKTLLLSGVLKAKKDYIVLKVKKDNIGLEENTLSFINVDDWNIEDMPVIRYDSPEKPIISVTDSGCNADGIGMDFKRVKYSGENITFSVEWLNWMPSAHTIGPKFEIYRYERDELVQLNEKGGWEELEQICMPNSILNCTYNITEHYDISAPGRYRFECNGAWIDFEVRHVEDKDAEIDKTMLFDISGGGKYDQGYIYVSDFGCESENISIEPKQIKRDGDGIVFILEWSNERDINYNLGKPFKILRYTDNGELEELSYIGASSDPNNPVYPVWEAVGYVVWKKSKSGMDYNITDYYDISLPGKYRFESYGAWIDFEVMRSQTVQP